MDDCYYYYYYYYHVATAEETNMNHFPRLALSVPQTVSRIHFLFVLDIFFFVLSSAAKPLSEEMTCQKVLHFQIDK